MTGVQTCALPICQTIGRTRERVRQIQNQALDKLKSFLEEDGLIENTQPNSAAKKNNSVEPDDGSDDDLDDSYDIKTDNRDEDDYEEEEKSEKN